MELFSQGLATGPASPLASPLPPYPPGLHNLPHALVSGPGELVERMGALAAVRHMQERHPGQQGVHLVGPLRLNRLSLLSTTGTDVWFALESSQHLHLVACFHGAHQVLVRGETLVCRPGEALLLPTGERQICGAVSVGCAAALPLVDLATTCQVMTGDRDGVTDWQGRLDAVGPRLLAVGAGAEVVHRLLEAIDASVAVDADLALHLALDDALLRAAVVQLNPEVLQVEPVDQRRCQEREGRSSFDLLIDYIRANLHEPLRMSDLERRSHYSTRALQYAFRQHFGLTPRQWIRRERLQLAYQALHDGTNRDPIHRIALACGYRHPGLFSADFRQRFGISPSVLRRRASSA